MFTIFGCVARIAAFAAATLHAAGAAFADTVAARPATRATSRTRTARA